MDKRQDAECREIAGLELGVQQPFPVRHRKPIRALAGLVISVVTGGCASSPSTLSTCQVVTQPERYQSQAVVLEDVFVNTAERQILSVSDAQCPKSEFLLLRVSPDNEALNAFLVRNDEAFRRSRANSAYGVRARIEGTAVRDSNRIFFLPRRISGEEVVRADHVYERLRVVEGSPDATQQ